MSNADARAGGDAAKRRHDRRQDRACRQTAMTTVHIAMLDPTDRSIPPEMMMTVAPSAAVPTTAVFSRMICRLSSVRKCSRLQDGEDREDEK